jgi:RNA polymerase sigma-70 factor (ECF subfamily)
MTASELVCRAYEAHSAEIYRHIFTFGLGATAAQDLTQETFLCLFESLCKGHCIEKPRPWLFTVASRIAMRQLHRDRSEVTLQTPDITDLISMQVDHGHDPEQSVLNLEKTRKLAAAIQTLSAQQRVCLHLRAEGLRYREIAEVTSLSIPSVAEFVRRAVNRIKSSLEAA